MDPFKLFIILALSIPFITVGLKFLFGSDKDTPKIVVHGLSWAVGVFLTVVCQLFGVGFLQGVNLLGVILYGLIAGFAANGVSETKFIQKILLLFKKKS